MGAGAVEGHHCLIVQRRSSLARRARRFQPSVQRIDHAARGRSGKMNAIRKIHGLAAQMVELAGIEINDRLIWAE